MEMIIDVDVAVVLPVNMMPLIDDTDFKTRETAIAYNAAGMDLVWNFTTSAGATTQTAVTPTTGGVYDWTHLGDGMYTIEIPASGGASINNNTEGYGFFTGFVTGVLPWRSPVFCFRAAGLNDLLCDNAYSTTRGLAGTALPNAAAEAAGGLVTNGTGAGQISTSSGRVLMQGSWIKNTAVTNYAFIMTDSTNHNPLPGLGDADVDVSYSHDGGETFTSLGDAAEGVNGVYYKTLTNTAMNADVVMLKMTGTGADQLNLTINTIP